MAKSVKINGVVYNSVPSVSIPLSDDSGTASFVDTSDATVDATKILQNYSGYGADGTLIKGTLTCANVSQDASSKVVTIS